MPAPRVIKKTDRQAAPPAHCNMQSNAEQRTQDLEIRRSALALAAAIARKHGLISCPTCGRKAA